MKYLAILLFLVGCSSTWVQKDFANKKGVIKYKNKGFTSAKHADAIEEMNQFCLPQRAKITQESYSESLGGAAIVNNMILPVSHEFKYLHFECI